MKPAIPAAGKLQPSDEEETSARACAAALLARRIDYGHARLAILRLAAVTRIGPEISPEHWDYCSRITAGCNDPGLQKVFAKAVSEAKGIR